MKRDKYQVWTEYGDGSKSAVWSRCGKFGYGAQMAEIERRCRDLWRLGFKDAVVHSQITNGGRAWDFNQTKPTVPAEGEVAS